jgi:hypothetical protein
MPRSKLVSEGKALFTKSAIEKYGFEIVNQCKPVQTLPTRGGHTTGVYKIKDLEKLGSPKENSSERKLIATILIYSDKSSEYLPAVPHQE